MRHDGRAFGGGTPGPRATALSPREDERRRTEDSDFYYRRFNRRFDLFQHWLMIAFPIIFAMVAATQHITLTMAAIHLGMYLTVLGFRYVTRPRDSMATFLVTYAFWFYSFMLFVYALFHWQSPEDSLYTPWLSSMVAAVTLLSCMAGYVVARLVVRFFGLPAWHRVSTPAEKRFTGVGLMLFAAPFMMLPFAGRDVSLYNAAAGLFEPLLWLGLIVYCVGRGPRAAVTLPVLLVGLIAVAVSIGLNGRATMLSFGIAAMILYFALAERPLTIFRVILLYFGANAVGTVSAIMIGARERVGHEASTPVVLKAIFSSDFLLAIVGIKSVVDPRLAIRDELARNDQYLIYFFGGRSGLSERLTLMPHMDVVISRLPNYMHVDRGEVKNTFLSALPSIFGQVKETDYSDRLVWELGLFHKDTTGHPMVTAPGEAYAMGGMLTVSLMYVLLFATTLIWYEYSKRMFADRFIAAAALFSFSIYIVFTSSAITSIATPLRVYPAAVILFPLIQFVSIRLASGRRPGGTARVARTPA